MSDSKLLLTGKRNPAIDEWLSKVDGYVNQLLLPRFVKSTFDEFSIPAAYQYFIRKKKLHLAALTAILRILPN